MEFLNGPSGPWLEKIRCVPWNARLAGTGFGLLLALGLWLLVRPTPQVEYEALLEGQQLSAPQMARMVAAFQKHGLHDLRISGHEILIPSRQKQAYLVALDKDQAWPADLDATVDRALAGSNPLMSWQQSRENVQRGEKQMLARIVQEMNGIATAVVQYDEVRQPGFPPRNEVRAMVAVRAVGRRDLDDEEIEAIRDTVVAFKSGLERRNVTITDLNACRAYPGTAASDSRTASRSRAAAQRAVEEEFRTRIEERLAMYPGVVIAVHAMYDEGADRDAGAGEDSALRPARLTASIGVPKNYFRDVWRQRYGGTTHHSPAPTELQQIEQEISGTIQRAVTALLPPPAPGWQGASLVTVTSHDQLHSGPLEPTGLRNPFSWRIWSATLALAGLASVLGGMAYRRLRSGADVPASDGSGADEKSVAGLAALQEQLTNVVKRDPAAAADVLKQWLNRAA